MTWIGKEECKKEPGLHRIIDVLCLKKLTMSGTLWEKHFGKIHFGKIHLGKVHFGKVHVYSFEEDCCHHTVWKSPHFLVASFDVIVDFPSISCHAFIHYFSDASTVQTCANYVSIIFMNPVLPNSFSVSINS